VYVDCASLNALLVCFTLVFFVCVLLHFALLKSSDFIHSFSIFVSLSLSLMRI